MLRYEGATSWDLPAELEASIVEAALEFRYFFWPPALEDSELALARRAWYAEDKGLGVQMNALRDLDDVSLYIVAALLELEEPVATAIAMPLILKVTGKKDDELATYSDLLFDRDPASLFRRAYRIYRDADQEMDFADAMHMNTREDW